MSDRETALIVSFVEGTITEGGCAELLLAAEAEPKIAQQIARDLEDNTLLRIIFEQRRNRHSKTMSSAVEATTMIDRVRRKILARD